MDEETRTTLRELAAELRKHSDPLEPFRFRSTELHKIERVTELAYSTAQHVARVLDHLAEEADAEPCARCNSNETHPREGCAIYRTAPWCSGCDGSGVVDDPPGSGEEVPCSSCYPDA